MDFCDRTIGIIVENEDDPYATVDFNEVGAKLPLKSGIGLRTVVENQQRIELKFAVGNETRVIGITDREPFVFESAVPLPKDTLVIALLRVDENGKSTLEIEVPEFNLRQEEKDLEIDFWQETLTKGLSVTEDDFTKLQNNEAVDLSKYDENGELVAGVCASMPELMEQLNALIGLQEVKDQVQKRINQVEVEQKAKAAGAQRIGGVGSLHMLFTGNAGTGKTTIARMLGQMYQQLGVLPNGSKVVECTRGNLVGMYQGHSAKNVQDKFEEAKGGILFIDEAYSICRDSNDNFGQETVDEIVAQMENNRDSVMVILAGYEREMDEFLRKNSGLSSRIRNKINFPDYSVADMVQIFKKFCNGRNMHLEDESDKLIYRLLDIKSKQPDFGNARGVRNLFDEVLESQNDRIMAEIASGEQLTPEQFDTILKVDLEKVAGDTLGDEHTIDDLLAEMNKLVGLSEAKAKIQEMVDNIQVRKVMEERGISVPDDHGTLHLIFTGNAGTGKTSIARLLGEIYTKLGVLQKNVFVETGRADLVGQYQGQTAQLVMNKLDEADGGILFIDEAYTLINGDKDTFGQEAIQTLVAELENRRSHLMVILAGYTEEMKEFLKVNSGLASRLSNEVYFADYTLDELTSIFFGMAKKRGLNTDGLDRNFVENWIQVNKENEMDFGNARGVRNLLESAIRKKDSRIANLIRTGEDLSNEALISLASEDLQ
jgi:SpoVK/Ycf46/Vps4 family AAA+-type ATPase